MMPSNRTFIGHKIGHLVSKTDKIGHKSDI